MDYDVAIIGAGWAGFNAAVSAKSYGLKTVLIEKSEIGGTCLNRGCIPTKSLIQSAKVFTLAKKSQSFGILVKDPAFDFALIQARKDRVIAQLGEGMNFMLKGIDVIKSQASVCAADCVRVGNRSLRVKNILIATGSRAMELPSFQFDGQKIISSDDVLISRGVPRPLLIIGGGVIGCEFASLFNMLGVGVSVCEKMPQLLPGVDREVARKIEIIFKKMGIQVRTGVDASSLNQSEYEKVLVCVGRTPECAGMNLENCGIHAERGRVTVDDYLRTSLPGVYAAGDCTSIIMLAHWAAYQGRIASHNIAHANSMSKCDTTVIPSCIFTDPEIASVGLDEEAARAGGHDVIVARFDFVGSGMARILDEAVGFIKIIFDKASNKILGGVIIGPRATELIATLALAVTCGLTIGQVQATIFAHPSISEVIGDAVHGI
jgi:dihydrolipoamide dehydrogenase